MIQRILYTHTHTYTHTSIGAYLAFATTTSIGYGDLYPRTPAGKIATCIYALLSLSVTGCFLSAWGDFVQNQCMGVWEHGMHMH